MGFWPGVSEVSVLKLRVSKVSVLACRILGLEV